MAGARYRLRPPRGTWKSISIGIRRASGTGSILNSWRGLFRHQAGIVLDSGRPKIRLVSFGRGRGNMADEFDRRASGWKENSSVALLYLFLSVLFFARGLLGHPGD